MNFIGSINIKLIILGLPLVPVIPENFGIPSIRDGEIYLESYVDFINSV